MSKRLQRSKPTLPNLSADDLESILEQWQDSEDGLDFSDDDDVMDPTYVEELNEEGLQHDSDEDIELPVDQVINSLPQNCEADISSAAHNTEPPSTEPVPSTSSEITNHTRNTRVQKPNVIWKTKHLELNEDQMRFRGSSNLPNEILELQTAYQVFSYLFPENVVDLIRDQTNLYSVQKDAAKPANVTNQEVRQFIGIIYFMSIVHMPNVRMYWSERYGYAHIRETMPLKRFELLRQLLHFNDNSNMLPYGEPNSDRLYKIRPIIEKLNENFGKVPLEQHLSIDEQMCSTKARSSLKQYLPDKPHKWGFKLFVICGVSGFGYKFEVYSGKENISAESEPQLGASSNVVVRLARDIPVNQNYRLFFDNYYTSLPLMEFLSNRGILALGTVRKNRIPNNKLPDDKQFKKQPRGTSVEQVGNYNGIDISVVAWRDNKIVNLVSNFAGKNPTSVVRRFDRALKSHINVERPFIVAEYNRHMGGVDLMDSVMGHYKIKLRSKRWYIRLFYHFLDMTMTNSWMLYRRILTETKNTDKVLNSADFRLQIAETLVNYKKTNCLKRTSELEALIQDKKKKGPCQHVPPKDVRLDQSGHWPVWTEKRLRCKYPGCTGTAQTECIKCGVALCFNKHNNCFRSFHNT